MENLWPSYCGLESSIPFTGTYDGQRCEGTIGDWNENTCLTESSLILRSDTCSALLIPQGNVIYLTSLLISYSNLTHRCHFFHSFLCSYPSTFIFIHFISIYLFIYIFIYIFIFIYYFYMNQWKKANHDDFENETSGPKLVNGYITFSLIGN